MIFEHFLVSLPVWISIAKPVDLSSTWLGNPGSFCTDGNIVSECSTDLAVTKKLQHVTVDLESMFHIQGLEIVVTNLVIKNRFRNVKIFIYNQTIFSQQAALQCDSIATEPVWSPYNGLNLYKSSNCTNLIGQFIRIEMTGLHNDAYLQMFEVMAYGQG